VKIFENARFSDSRKLGRRTALGAVAITGILSGSSDDGFFAIGIGRPGGNGVPGGPNGTGAGFGVGVEVGAAAPLAGAPPAFFGGAAGSPVGRVSG
jgi:hypothetical protein